MLPVAATIRMTHAGWQGEMTSEESQANPTGGAIRWAVAGAIATGVAAAVGQVVLLRELMVISGGNELALGLALTCWMMGTAAGSGLGGISLRLGRPGEGTTARWTAISLAVSAVALPTAPALLHAARGHLGTAAGEALGLGQQLAVAAVAFVPPCLALGLVFPLLCRTLAPGRGGAVARTFGLEAAGFAAAGLVFSLLLVTRVPGAVALLAVASLLAVMACGLWSSAGPRFRAVAALALLLPIVAGLLARGVEGPPPLGGEWVATEDSVHARIDLRRDGEQLDVYLDGSWSFVVPDDETVERAVHPSMLQHASPRRVLLLGGAVDGSLPEVLRHPGVERVDVVELDAQLVELARQHLPGPVIAALDDPRVRVLHTDGRAWLRRNDERYDVVLWRLPDPHNAQLNRFYTVEFFTQVRGALAPGGLASVGVDGSPHMLGPVQARYVASVRETMASVFEVVLALPGAEIRLLGAGEDGQLIRDAAVLSQRLEAREMGTRYVTPALLRFDLGAMPIDHLGQVLDQAATGERNRDLIPICYFHDAMLGAAVSSPRLLNLYQRLEKLRPGWIVLWIAVGFLLHAAATRAGPLAPAARRMTIPAAVAVAGATGIVAEVALILGYQVAFGNLFARVGVLIAAYMAGLALGAYAVARGRPRPGPGTLLIAQGLLGVLCAALWVLSSKAGVAHAPAALELLFALVTAAVGLLAGVHFASAVHGRPAGAGGLYAVDLAGAAVASLAASALLFPVLGVPAVLGLLALLNLGAVVVLAAGNR